MNIIDIILELWNYNDKYSFGLFYVIFSLFWPFFCFSLALRPFHSLATLSEIAVSART